MVKSQKNFVQWLGLLGIVSFISYAAAVVLAPLAYPGYDWKSQAVSDLMAADAPSRALWNQLSSLYGAGGLVCVMMVCVAVQGRWSKTLRLGIYSFAAMWWVSVAGFAAFPLSEGGASGTMFQDAMHIAVTAAVVALSITALVLIMIGGYRKKRFVSLAVYATVALALMFAGSMGTGVAPQEYFGVFQRFSNLISANGFTAILGIYLFMGKFNDGKRDAKVR